MTTTPKALELAKKLEDLLHDWVCANEAAAELRRLSALEQQGEAWVKASDRVPLESDGEVFVRFADGSIGTGWATYWHGSSNGFAQWTFPDPDEFRMVSDWAKNVPASTGMHWTENEPVRLPASRAGRVYLAGPMTGLPELNFPAFNQEAERLRAEGLQVLNPADHGIVDGADWADYLRHDIAGLASCERIHLLRGWTKSKGACLEMTIAKALGMTVTYQVDAEIEHSTAPPVPQGEPVDFDSIIEDVEAIDCRYRGDPSYDRDPYYIRERAANVVRRHAAYYATPAPAPAQDEPFGYFRAEPFGWTDCAKDDEGAIALYEHPAADLTDEQIRAVGKQFFPKTILAAAWFGFARAIIAKVKGVEP